MAARPEHKFGKTPGSPAGKASPARRRARLRTASLSCALFVLAAAVYLPAVSGEQLPDDQQYVTENRLLADATGLARIWTSPGRLPQYYPLTFTTFWVEHRLWGDELAGYHVVNILLHGLAAVLLYRLLAGLGLSGAWLAAALLAVHPVMVASVAWVAERKNVLSGVFYVGSLICLARWLGLTVGPPGRRAAYYAAGLGLFACALGSKTATCTLPVAVLILAWWRRGRIDGRAWLGLLPMFVLAAAMGGVTIWTERQASGAAALPFDFSPAQRILIAARALWFYAGKLFWPMGLCAVYPRWRIDPGQWWQWLWPALAAAGLAAAFSLRAKLGRGPLAAALLFVVSLGPALGLVNFGYMVHSFVADHLMYLAGVFPVAMAVSAAARLAGRWSGRGRAAAAIVAAGLVAVLAGLTWNRAAIYGDAERLWSQTIARNPASFMAYVNRGVHYAGRDQLDLAIDDYNEAIRLARNDPVAWKNRGNVYYKMEDYDRAIKDYTKAITLFPSLMKAYLGRGKAWGCVGKYHRAIADLDKAVELDPACGDAYAARGLTFEKMGDYARALSDYDKAVELLADEPDAYSRRAMTFSKMGRYAEALSDLNAAVRLAPNEASSYHNRAIVYQKLGRPGEAMRDLDAAIRLDPAYAKAYNSRGVIYGRMGAPGRAVQDFRKAIEHDPNYDEPYLNEAFALRQLGREADLVAFWREAAALRPDWPVALNGLAWVLAVSRDERLRDGPEAVRLARRACELAGGKRAGMLDTLAAACAEAGLFDEAVEAGRQALKLAEAEGDEPLAEAVSKRLALYSSQKPYRQASIAADVSSVERPE